MKEFYKMKWKLFLITILVLEAISKVSHTNIKWKRLKVDWKKLIDGKITNNTRWEN